MPSTYISDVTKEWIMLLFAIFIGILMDVRAIIMPSIKHALQKSTTIKLVNLHLIFGLCKEANVR